MNGFTPKTRFLTILGSSLMRQLHPMAFKSKDSKSELFSYVIGCYDFVYSLILDVTHHPLTLVITTQW